MAERVTGMKILLVDDDERFRNVLRIILGIALNDPEAVVDCAASFKEALSRVAEASYDLLLFDYNLGSRTGLDLYGAVREMGVETPVIFLTGDGDEKIAVAAMKAGALDYLPKSAITPGLLEESVRNAIILHEKRIHAQLAEERIRSMFSSFVTKRVADAMVRNPDMAKLGGERRELTILFSDVRNFTSYSEKYAPEEVVSILNEYLAEMTEVIFEWGGTLDKFLGDGILAFWGAPEIQDNHAGLAVKCALHMVKKLEELQRKWRAEGKPVLDCGIGINTGEVIVGNIGAERKKMDYTVIGDHVNLVARVVKLTKKYDARILITEFTLAKIRTPVNADMLGHVSIRGLEKVVLDGKEVSVQLNELKSVTQEAKSVVTGRRRRPLAGTIGQRPVIRLPRR